MLKKLSQQQLTDKPYIFDFITTSDIEITYIKGYEDNGYKKLYRSSSKVVTISTQTRSRAFYFNRRPKLNQLSIDGY